MQHYFLDQRIAPKDIINLPSDISHHLARVLRATINDRIELVGNDHHVFRAKLIEVENHSVTAQIEAALNVNVELPVDVTIVSGLSKKNKAEWVVQKATELGANQIIFMPMAWSVVNWGQKYQKKIHHLNEVALSAAEQSHRNVIPQVHYFNDLAQLLAEPFDAKVVAYEESAKVGEQSRLVASLSQLTAHQSLVGIFGPEGGISPEEIQQLTNHGFISVGLGPRIMRTETAPLYFLSAVSLMTELIH